MEREKAPCTLELSFHFILNSLYRVKLQKSDLQTALLIYKTNYNIPLNTIKIYAQIKPYTK